MQDELIAEGYADIELLAVNAAGLESGNAAASVGVDLPLLQDTASADVWGQWGVTWRDVVVLDRDNVPVSVFNLTAHNLANAVEYEALKQILIDTANAP